jgi:alkylation response protein AidB-like acyl-CoA dehydrogenase
MTRRVLPSFGLGQDHLALRELARQVAEEQVATHAAEVDEHGEFPEKSLRALVDAGLHAVGIPEEYRGQWGGHLASAAVAEEIARACATTQQVTGANELFSLPLLVAGSDEVKQRYLPRVASGEWLGAFALSEPEAGSDIGAISTRAAVGYCVAPNGGSPMQVTLTRTCSSRQPIPTPACPPSWWRAAKAASRSDPSNPRWE